jgi:hypothetical protein
MVAQDHSLWDRRSVEWVVVSARELVVVRKQLWEKREGLNHKQPAML